MKDSTQKLIREYCDIISTDHHKTRDGCFEITNYYNAWSEKHTWYVNHPGYINEIEAYGDFNNHEEAEEFLIKKLNGWIKSEKEMRYNPDGTLKDLEW